MDIFLTAKPPRLAASESHVHACHASCVFDLPFPSHMVCA
jgi:hypothetical protein